MQVALVYEDMKVTIAVLDKNGDSAVNRVLDLLNSFDVGQPSHFGLISPKKSVLEKNVEIIKKQGLKSSTVARLRYLKTQVKQVIMSIYSWMMQHFSLKAEFTHLYQKLLLRNRLPKEPLHCEAALQTANGASGWRLLVP